MSESPAESNVAPQPFPRLPWGVAAAFVIFLASLAMPAWDSGWSTTPAGAERFLGWQCAQWSATFLWEVLKGGDDDLLEASFTIPNLLMLCVPGLPLIRPVRRRLWPAVAATVATLHVMYWRVAKHEPDEHILIGYWFWLGSFATLACALWLWEARVHKADRLIHSE
ncbi:MAG: hypothetical protein FD180_259 [Planctomycetota bacterium]|nr:MAG: hypothetical protein FD180_259 [Planctomycetota bacterium]